jgi:hypothetical protein
MRRQRAFTCGARHATLNDNNGHGWRLGATPFPESNRAARTRPITATDGRRAIAVMRQWNVDKQCGRSK